MVKKLAILLVVLATAFTLSASDYELGASLDMMGLFFKGTLTGMDISSFEDALLGESSLQEDKYIPLYSSEVKTYLKTSSSALKGEVKGAFSFAKMDDQNVVAASLEKANIKFRFPSPFKRKMTVTVGKAPISWGLGSYYRIGDVLLSSLSHNEKAGESDSRNIWMLELSQNFGSGFAADAALSIPLEDQILSGGITLRKTFSSDFMKGIYGFYSYNENNVYTVAAAADVSMYFDVTLGIQSSFRGYDDYRAAVNMMKQYSIDGESSSCSIGLYLSSELDFYKKQYEVMSAFSINPGDRTSVYLAVINRFSDSAYKGILCQASLEFLAVDGVKFKAGGIYSYNNTLSKNSYAGFIGMEAAI